MAEIPRLSYDLIDLLAQSTPAPQWPTTITGIENLSSSEVRKLAFAAGYRAFVDMLLDLRNQDEEEANAENQSDEDVGDEPFGRVFGPDGEPHSGVASTYMATRIATDYDGDGGIT
jgi:hypothetical protein